MKQSKAQFNALLISLTMMLASCVPPSPVVKKDLQIIDRTTSDESSTKSEASEKTTEEVTSDSRVKIGIRIDVSSVQIDSDGPIQVESLSDHSKSTWNVPATVTAVDGQLLVGGKKKGAKLMLSPTGDHYLKIKDRGYRGNFILVAEKESKILVIDELTIDDYLKGVLPQEVVYTWPDESLKVQAVASRTYLASHLKAHASQGFDLCSDVHCQAYGGMVKEHPKCNKAVDDTKSEILTSNGKPIGAYFHSNCGGSTELISAVWSQDDKPYLPRKKCSFGTADPRYTWRQDYANGEILTLLKLKTRVEGTKLESLEIKKKSKSGRVQFIAVKTDKGTYTLKGNDFRIALNPEKIRSTLWTDFFKLKGGYQFKGKGWGHGVGMCQWGAKGMAEQGKNYREILNFYYPTAKLEKWARR